MSEVQSVRDFFVSILWQRSSLLAFCSSASSCAQMPGLYNEIQKILERHAFNVSSLGIHYITSYDITLNNVMIGHKSDHCLVLSVNQSVSLSLMLLTLDWFDPGVWSLPCLFTLSMLFLNFVQIVRFVKIVRWLSLCFYMDFSKLIHGFL